MSLYSSQTSNLPPLYQPSRQQGANSAPPTVANNTSAVEYPEVNNLSAEEIQSLLEDEDLFRDFILKQTSVKANSKMLTELRQTNYEISQRNIANEAPQRLLREEVAELQQLVATKQSTLQQLTEEKQRLLKDFSPEASYAKLKEAAEQAEAVSESIASQFLKGDITQDDFVRNFRDSRTIYHIRSAKLERLI